MKLVRCIVAGVLLGIATLPFLQWHAALAIIVGSSVIAIGGGGITPMRSQWEKALNKLEQEAPQMRQQTQVRGSASKSATRSGKSKSGPRQAATATTGASKASRPIRSPRPR